MRFSAKTIFIFMLAFNYAVFSHAQKQGIYNAIYSGTPWFDNNGNIISAHAACIVKDNNKYYLFGEKHSDTSNAFVGFNCYSSTDLYNWNFESLALPVQKAGILSANSVGERAKVMKCPKTGEYIMFMHVDSLTYKNQFVGYATSNNISGPYTFKGALLFNDKPIKKWDMGTFQDVDGEGYILIHGGEMYKLADDYKSVAEQINKGFTTGFEAPTLFRKDSIYYWLGSYLTSWERNDNYYFTATSIKGPWTNRGTFAPKGSLTYNSQSTFVLPITGTNGTTFMFMGDRWAFPKQASAATYVWQPLTIDGFSLSIPKYEDAWKINTITGENSSIKIGNKTIAVTNKAFVKYAGKWQVESSDTLQLISSDTKGDSFTVQCKCSQIGLYGLTRSNGGFAKVTLRNNKGSIVGSSIIDLYSRYNFSALKFLSPILKKDDYTLTVFVLGEHSEFHDKKNLYTGSTGNVVSLSKIVIKE